MTAFNCSVSSLQGRNWATRLREIGPADSNTFKCDEIVGCVIEKRPTKSDTDASPRPDAARFHVGGVGKSGKCLIQSAHLL